MLYCNSEQLIFSTVIIFFLNHLINFIISVLNMTTVMCQTILLTSYLALIICLKHN